MTRTRAERFFWAVTARPKLVLALSIAVIIGAASFLPELYRDTRNESWLNEQHPARLSRERTREIFGIGNPMLIAVIRDAPGGVFTPESLALVRWLTDEVARIPGVDPEQTMSLATERGIRGAPDGLFVEPFFDDPPTTQAEAAGVREQVFANEPLLGSLVSRDGRGTVIVAELVDDSYERDAYAMLREIVATAPVRDEVIHVAGIGAVQGYVLEYLDTDARRMNPVTLTMTLVLLFVAFRTTRAVLIPLFVILGTAIVALGTMAALGVPWYVLSGAMTVILVAVSVCDGIHILGAYYQERARSPDAPMREVVTRIMALLWRPITATSLTSIAGFLALASATFMPPLRAFGQFVSLGILTAMVLSLTAVPAILVLLRPGSSGAYHHTRGGGAAPDWFGRLTSAFGRAAVRRPAVVLLSAVVLLPICFLGAMQLRVEDASIAYFQQDEPIVFANEAINARFDGTDVLDIMVETDEPEGLYEPEVLRRIDALETFLQQDPKVGGTSSIVAYVKQMHRALHDDDPAYYAIPDDADLIAQYFFLYSASSSPTDFENLADSEFRLANVRVNLTSGLWSDIIRVVDAADQYVDATFNAPGVTATLSGTTLVNYHRAIELKRSQPVGVPMALSTVWALSAISLGSVVGGLFALIPVSLAVFLVYAAMGFSGIWLGTGTSIFAAIAIGLAVDFCLHVLERLRSAIRDRGLALEDALEDLFASSTGRGIFFNFLVITIGFGSLVTSQAPPMIQFGILVAICLSAAFLGSLLLLPALVKIVRPRFLGLEPEIVEAPEPARAPQVARTAGLLLCLTLPWAPVATAADTTLPPANEIVAKVKAVDDGPHAFQDVVFHLIDRHGKQRSREARYFRKEYDGKRHLAFFFDSPKNVKGTAFLTFDYEDSARDDDQWLYLPALRKVRRISASDRGSYFLGTDFTYDDIRIAHSITIEDYNWKTLRAEDYEGHPCYVVEGVPVSPEVGRELGYGRTESWVDANTWNRRRIEYWDVNGNPLKVVEYKDVRLLQGHWTVHSYEVRNLKTGHASRIEVRKVDYQQPIEDDLFTEAALRRGG